ncbi:DUF4123 domain-containing protein [Hafnia alvei]|uniref:DUF4123 domain-containing protein n=1 Tax=Hafnia alvei TaxID=569 RepID=UPI00404582C3
MAIYCASQNIDVAIFDWIKNTETSGSRLYAILASTNGGAALKAYYALDGKHTPQGLYADTPYANWYPVMPMLVELSPYSPFLTWVEEHATPAWGWLARSPLIESVIAQHLAGLTQVLMPNGQAVFFRYWDGRYLSSISNSSAINGIPFSPHSQTTGWMERLSPAQSTVTPIFPLLRGGIFRQN